MDLAQGGAQLLLSSNYMIPKHKLEQHKEIEEQIKDFEARGGRIEEVDASIKPNTKPSKKVGSFTHGQNPTKYQYD